jgi:hypothetical protein
MDLIQQIHARDGMTTVECQAYMMWKYGLKWERTTEYIRELAMSGILKESQGKWVVKSLPGDLFG